MFDTPIYTAAGIRVFNQAGKVFHSPDNTPDAFYDYLDLASGVTFRLSSTGLPGRWRSLVLGGGIFLDGFTFSIPDGRIFVGLSGMAYDVHGTFGPVTGHAASKMSTGTYPVIARAPLTGVLPGLAPVQQAWAVPGRGTTWQDLAPDSSCRYLYQSNPGFQWAKARFPGRWVPTLPEDAVVNQHDYYAVWSTSPFTIFPP